MKKSNRGITLLELVIVLAIAAILLALAIPSFSGLLKNNRLNTTVEAFTNAVNFARTEAVSKGRAVHFGPKDANGWTGGTAVWLDGDNDNAFDADEDKELRFIDKMPASQTFVSIPNTPAITYLSFSSTGLANRAATFAVCDDRANEQGRKLSLTQGGSISVKEFSCD